MSPSYFLTIKIMISSILLAQLVLMHDRYKSPNFYNSKYSMLHITWKTWNFFASNTILIPPSPMNHSPFAHHHKCNLKGMQGRFYTAKTHSTPQVGFKNTHRILQRHSFLPNQCFSCINLYFCKSFSKIHRSMQFGKKSNVGISFKQILK